MKINSLQVEIDGIDKEILRDLMEDARKPILQIANKIGVSGAAIHQRLRKLEQSGVISGSKFVVSQKVLGYNTMAFVGISWASIMSVPYVMLSKSVPAEKMGVYMGVFNMFIVIPQIVSMIVLPLIYKPVLGNSPSSPGDAQSSR